MNSELRFAELGECLTLVIDHRGKTPGKLDSDWVQQGIPTISAKNVSNGRLVAKDAIRYVTHDVYRRWMNTGDVKRGDCLLVSEGATLGQCMYWDEDYPVVLGQRLFCLRTNPDVLYPRYLYFYMSTHGFQSEIMGRATGTSVHGLRQTEVLKLRIRLPSLEEQHVVGDTLYNLNKKIDLNRRMNETLEAMARALFKSWFVDFDPVRAKHALSNAEGAEGRDTGLPKSLADLFPDSFESSELGEIPKGWKIKPLPEVVKVNPLRSLRKNEAAPYLDMANMPTRGHSPAEIVERSFGSGMRFINGDTLVARITPCLENGKTAFVDFLKKGQVGWGSTEYIVMRPTPPLPEEFAYCLVRSDAFRDFAIQSMTGSSGRQRVPVESLSHYLLVIPPDDIAKCFGIFIQPLFARAGAATRESRTLAALRDTLLPKLISGELRVRNEEKMVGVVA